MRWARPLAVAACGAYPLLNHAAAVFGEPRYAALGIALVVLALALTGRRPVRGVVAGAAAFGLGLWAAARFPGVLLFTPPIVINLALCTLFAGTLREGREPLVSGFARIQRGGVLAPDLERYTRNLTWAWAGFFLMMAIISATLAVTGPLATWSLFSNVLSYLLVALFFVVEYVYRRVRYRHHSHATPWQMVLGLRDFKPLARSPGGHTGT